MKIKGIILAILFLGSVFARGEAAYLRNVPQERVQPDGTVLHCLATGDEYHNWLHDANNFTIIQDPVTGYYVYAAKEGVKLVPTSFTAGISDPAAAGLQPGLNLDPDEIARRRQVRLKGPSLKSTVKTTTTGIISNIVIFIRFSDQPEYIDGISSYQSAFNKPGSVSMLEYFREVSKAQLTINTSLFPATGGTTVISFQDAHERNYYCGYNLASNPVGYVNYADSKARETALLKNATEAVSAQIAASGLNLDSNSDGNIDNICYIIQGAPEGWGELLWPRRSELESYEVRIAGLRVWSYNFILSGSLDVSVLCHEMSHSIGFPDLYRYTNAGIEPVGPWDIMGAIGSLPQQHCVYTKLKYGQWISDIPEITASGNYQLSPLSSDAFAGYVIKSPSSLTEYFVIEYRKAAGLFESGLAGSGLIIYRVNPTVNGNRDGPPDEVYVYRRNGTVTMNGNINSAYFSSEAGRTTFNAGSNPSCFLSDGSAGGIEITNIGSAGDAISFTVNLDYSRILSVTPDSRALAFTGGNTSFAVANTGAGFMDWTAAVTSGSSWLHVTSGASGTNAGTISVSADANPDNAIRTGIITVTSGGATGSPKQVAIVQAANPPVIIITPPSRSMDFKAGNTTFEVSNSGGGRLEWSASVTNGQSWVHITSGAEGSNSGTIGVSVDTNPNNSIRTGIITITAAGAGVSPQYATVIQGANPPALQVLPSLQSVEFTEGSTSFEVTNTGGGSLEWSASVTSGATWMHIASGSSGTNTGFISVSADVNPDNAPRTGIITITADGATGSPQAVSVIQAAHPPSLSVRPSEQPMDFTAGSTSFEVANSGGGTLEWTAAVTTGFSWMHITSGNSGTNSGTITVTSEANPDNSVRTGTITITAPGASGSPLEVTVIQAACPPALIILPTTRSMDFTAGATFFDVSNGGGGTMDWTADVTTGPSWLQITSGTSGSNDGTIIVAAVENTEYAIRTGVVTVSAHGATGSPVTLIIEQAAKPIRKPDLVITRLDAFVPSVTWPEKIRISIIVSNIGEGPSQQTEIGFFLSNSPSRDSLSEDLGRISCGPVADGSTWAKDVDLSFNENILPGSYYLLAMADSPDINMEINETNNLGSCRISVLNAIENHTEHIHFSVFPVPADHTVTILYESDGIHLEKLLITDILGQMIYSDIPDQNLQFTKTINVTNWSKGCYNISLYTRFKLFHKLIIIH